jgi:hypothetical protein
MDNQTPISQLNNMGSPDNNVDNTVDDIINQINSDGSPGNYQEMPATAPPPQQQQYAEQPPQQQYMEQAPLAPAAPTQMLPPPDNIIDTSDLDTNISSLTDNIIKSVKHPLIIVILYILLNLKQVDNLFKYKTVALLVGEDGNLTFTSVVIKAVVLGLLFYLIKVFV